MQPRITRSQIYLFVAMIILAVLIYQSYSSRASVMFLMFATLGWVYRASGFKVSRIFRPPPPKEKVIVEKAWKQFVEQLTTSTEHFAGCSEEDINHLMELYDVDWLPQPYIAFLQKYGRGAKDVETAFKLTYDDLPTIMNTGLEIASNINPQQEKKIIFAEFPYDSTSIFLYFAIFPDSSEDPWFSNLLPDDLEEYEAYRVDPPVDGFSVNGQPFKIQIHLSLFLDGLLVD